MQHGIKMENTLSTNSQEEMGHSLPQDNCDTSTHSLSPVDLKISADDTVKRASTHLNNKTIDSALCPDLGLNTGSDMPGNDIS